MEKLGRDNFHTWSKALKQFIIRFDQVGQEIIQGKRLPLLEPSMGDTKDGRPVYSRDPEVLDGTVALSNRGFDLYLLDVKQYAEISGHFVKTIRTGSWRLS